MGLPVTFGTETAATGGQLDQNFAAVGALGTIPCVITGTNGLTLTPAANTPTISAYSNYLRFSGVIAVTSTGTVTASVAPLGILPVYLDTASGPVVAGSGSLVAGNAVQFVYDSALNGGSGGLHVTAISSGAQITGTPTAGHIATWASATSLQDGGVAPGFHAQVFTSSGTFTTPSNTLATTVFKITLTGAGGGAYVGTNVAGGGAGATVIYYATNLPPSSANTITLGVGGTTSATAPTGGTDSTAVITTNSGTVTLTASGGGGATSGNGGLGGQATNGSVNINGGDGLSAGAPPPTNTDYAPGGASFYGSATNVGGQHVYGAGANAFGSVNGQPALCIVEYVI